jgi:transient-receptor-potential calcium channel protein
MADSRFHRKKTVRKGKGAANTLSPEGSGLLKEPKKEDEEFLRAVELGDIPTVRKLFSNPNNHVDCNCTDILGRTPLRLAVENEHLEIVELLLDRSEPRKLYEALLLAISLDHDEIAEVILKHPIYEKLEKQESIYSSNNFYLSLVGDDSQFTAETTPLILAAQRNRFEIVSLLIRKGNKIEKPHQYNCECPHCKAKQTLDELRYAKSRLNAYKGLASEAYISLFSDDPILTAFQLGQELRHVAAKEKHYRGEYEGLAKKLSEYVVKLVDHVRGNDELDVILNEEVEGYGPDCHGKLARLKLAIKFDEKRFVAHPSCQKKLTSIWYGTVQFVRLNPLIRPIFVIALAIAFPVLSIGYLLAPGSKVGDFLRTPFIKFLGQSASFLVFLALIVTFSFTEKPSSGTIDDLHRDYLHVVNLNDFRLFFNEIRPNLTGHFQVLGEVYIREFIPGIYQMLICLWIVGMLWQECKQLYNDGVEGYFGSLFNFIDFASLKLYIASFSLRFVSFYKTYYSLMYLNERKSWQKLQKREPYALYRSYWLIADRSYWHDWDPMLMCEGLFSVANVLSFSRLFYLLAANEQLGPLQISLRRMIADIMKFMVIFFIVFLAFLVGLNNLYWYYDPTMRKMVQVTIGGGEPPDLTSKADKAFGTIELTFRTVYWALFGMGEPNAVELNVAYSKAFTERLGYLVNGAYNFAAVIVLLNMLIAMMSRSFDTIQNSEHVEWKFARAQLYMDYIQEGSTLPPPINIVPSPKSFIKLFSPLTNCLRKYIFKKKRKPRRIQRRTVRFNDPYNVNSLHYDVLNHSQGQVTHKVGQLSPLQSIPEQGRLAPPSATFGEGTDTEDELLEFEIPMEQMTTAQILKMAEDPARIVAMHAQRKTEKPNYQTVIKSVVKRYIFESQKDDASPMEAEVDELKQGGTASHDADPLGGPSSAWRMPRR